MFTLPTALLLASIACVTLNAAETRSWYVDCSQGNDANDGLSRSRAWKSVAAVSAHTFRPGDAVRFRRATVCTGMLSPKGSGSSEAPILLDAWGTGPLPRIQARDGEQAALKLFDQEYWTIQHLEFSGGNPYGIYVSGSRGILHGIHIKDLVVHDVTGQPKNKETGLLVIAAGTEQQHFDDVLIDGATVYNTSQWAGILVGGVEHGFPPEASRNTNVIIRNSIAHDVTGDGIVLFQVNNGTIENSVAWRTGMQDTETIGTPNAIWTWMCRNCTVRNSEAFLTDSPGVDGGAFDIDYGNDNNLVEGNYAHDTQGYCVAVFGAGWVTTESIVRGNTCVHNGLSPRLARRQGAIFLSTWDRGKIRGLEISGNRIFWDPPLATAAIVNGADFIGNGAFEKNRIESCSPEISRGNSRLVFKDNLVLPCSQELSAEPKAQGWCLRVFVSLDEQDHASRGQVTLIESIHRQFSGLRVEIVASRKAGVQIAPEDVRYNWNTEGIPVVFDAPENIIPSRFPSLILTNSSGNTVWRHDGFTVPGDIGLALRSLIGKPEYARMRSDQ